MNITKAVSEIWQNAQVDESVDLEPLLTAANRIADALERLAEIAEEGGQRPPVPADPAEVALNWRNRLYAAIEGRFGRGAVVGIRQDMDDQEASSIPATAGPPTAPTTRPLPNPDRTAGFRNRVVSMQRAHLDWGIAECITMVRNEMIREQDQVDWARFVPMPTLGGPYPWDDTPTREYLAARQRDNVQQTATNATYAVRDIWGRPAMTAGMVGAPIPIETNQEVWQAPMPPAERGWTAAELAAQPILQYVNVNPETVALNWTAYEAAMADNPRNQVRLTNIGVPGAEDAPQLQELPPLRILNPLDGTIRDVVEPPQRTWDEYIRRSPSQPVDDWPPRANYRSSPQPRWHDHSQGDLVQQSSS